MAGVEATRPSFYWTQQRSQWPKINMRKFQTTMVLIRPDKLSRADKSARFMSALSPRPCRRLSFRGWLSINTYRHHLSPTSISLCDLSVPDHFALRWLAHATANNQLTIRESASPTACWPAWLRAGVAPCGSALVISSQWSNVNGGPSVGGCQARPSGPGQRIPSHLRVGMPPRGIS